METVKLRFVNGLKTKSEKGKKRLGHLIKMPVGLSVMLK